MVREQKLSPDLTDSYRVCTWRFPHQIFFHRLETVTFIQLFSCYFIEVMKSYIDSVSTIANFVGLVACRSRAGGGSAALVMFV